MRDDLLREVTARLKRNYALKEKGTYLREGKCPSCGKKELYVSAERPWVLRCGRENRCGETFEVKKLYPDIFEDWSKRYERTEAAPNAAADAYLQHARSFDLMGLRSAYTQEHYHGRELNIGSATVRFPLPGGGWWERLIDQPGRFGKKTANFAWGHTHKGEWWQHPADTIDVLARADELWIVEGIFDALSLRQVRDKAGIIHPGNPKLGIPPRAKHLHDCRSTFVTKLCRAGLSDQEIAGIVPWSIDSVATIRRTYVDDAAIVVALSERIRRAM